LSNARYIIVGGAGFIGSHFVDRLLGSPETAAITVYDNFSSGQRWHLEDHEEDERLEVVVGEAADTDSLCEAMEGADTVIHLASNPDIAKAMTEPSVDFHEGTALTFSVVEAMRRTGTGEILYASGSGVYGDLGEFAIPEDHGPLVPTSTYGASKLAGESMICAYAYMFGLRGLAFRFGNVVGRRQTHGVGFDFVRRLRAAPEHLRILGDGRQRKSYVHVGDVVGAVLHAREAVDATFEAFNVATGDEITVTEIADLSCECLGLDPAAVRYDYAGGDRGWKGDVPIVRLAIDKIKGIGWEPEHNSRGALKASLEAMLGDLDAGRS